MANNINKTDLSGMLGERISLQKVSNRVVVTNRPKRKFGPPTEKQQSVQDRFQGAAYYAKLQLADPDGQAYYRLAATEKARSAYNAAVADYLVKPEVQSIDTSAYTGQAGDTIEAFAKGYLKAEAVKVIIKDRKGNLIEKGDAVMGNLHIWKYTATVANPNLPGTTIQVIVFNRPGSKGTKEVTL